MPKKQKKKKKIRLIQNVSESKLDKSTRVWGDYGPGATKDTYTQTDTFENTSDITTTSISDINTTLNNSQMYYHCSCFECCCYCEKEFTHITTSHCIEDTTRVCAMQNIVNTMLVWEQEHGRLPFW